MAHLGHSSPPDGIHAVNAAQPAHVFHDVSCELDLLGCWEFGKSGLFGTFLVCCIIKLGYMASSHNI